MFPSMCRSMAIRARRRISSAPSDRPQRVHARPAPKDRRCKKYRWGTVAAVYEDVNELRWCVIPLLAVMQGGEYALFQFVHTVTSRYKTQGCFLRKALIGWLEPE